MYEVEQNDLLQWNQALNKSLNFPEVGLDVEYVLKFSYQARIHWLIGN